MTRPIAADAGPLIGLARAGLLDILPQLYRTVEVPAAVVAELRIDENRPGSRTLRDARSAGWLRSVELQDPEWVEELPLGRGEAEAIVLALERHSRFLLVDERRARALARSRGVAVVGTGGALVAAKESALVPSVGRALDRLAAVGYRLSPALRTEILRLAGE